MHLAIGRRQRARRDRRAACSCSTLPSACASSKRAGQPHMVRLGQRGEAAEPTHCVAPARSARRRGSPRSPDRSPCSTTPAARPDRCPAGVAAEISEAAWAKFSFGLAQCHIHLHQRDRQRGPVCGQSARSTAGVCFVIGCDHALLSCALRLHALVLVTRIRQHSPRWPRRRFGVFAQHAGSARTAGFADAPRSALPAGASPRRDVDDSFSRLGVRADAPPSHAQADHDQDHRPPSQQRSLCRAAAGDDK